MVYRTLEKFYGHGASPDVSSSARNPPSVPSTSVVYKKHSLNPWVVQVGMFVHSFSTIKRIIPKVTLSDTKSHNVKENPNPSLIPEKGRGGYLGHENCQAIAENNV